MPLCALLLPVCPLLAADPPGLLPLRGGRTEIGLEVKDLEPLVRASGRAKIVDETPRHRVRVDPFLLMETEVTVEQYLVFVEATGHRPPRSWAPRAYEAALAKFAEEQRELAAARAEAGERPVRETFDATAWWERHGTTTEWETPTEGLDLPVEFVSYGDARAFCRWAGLRLPTELELQHAVRGDTDRDYPWGDDWEEGRHAAVREHGRTRPWPVGSFPGGASEDGIFDLCGNVWEWTSSPYLGFPGYEPRSLKASRRAPATRLAADFDMRMRVVVGGSYYSGAIECRASVRRATPTAVATEGLGFRCAASPLPGLDTARAIVDAYRPADAPDGAASNLVVERTVGAERWRSREGAGGRPVILGHDHLLFVPTGDLAARGRRALERRAAEEGPVFLGLLSTSAPLVEHGLGAGAWRVFWAPTTEADGEAPAEVERLLLRSLDEAGAVYEIVDFELAYGPAGRGEVELGDGGHLRAPIRGLARHGQRAFTLELPAALAGEGWRTP